VGSVRRQPHSMTPWRRDKDSRHLSSPCHRPALDLTLVMAMAFMGGMGVIYLTFAVVLIASPAVSAFLAYQRESLPQKSKFERHRVGKVFLLPKNTILKPHDRLTLIIPARMRDALNCDSSGEIALSADGEKVHVRLDVGAQAWMSESSQAFLLPWCDGENASKLIQLTRMPKGAESQ
jgi:hypothetical protein